MAGIASAYMMSAVSIAMAYAGGELVNNVFGFSKTGSIAVITLVVMIYSSFGGIRATIQTDAFQLLNFVVLIPILAFLLIHSESFTWNAYASHATKATKMAMDTHTINAILGITCFWIFSNSGFTGDIVGRFLASKNVKVAKRATFYAGLFIFFWIILMVFIGSVGAFLYPDLGDNDQVLLHIAKNHFPGLLYGIFIIAMIGVVMSTMDTTMNSASIIFGEDIMGGFKPKLADGQKLRWSKIYTITLGIIAIIIASFLDSVLHALMLVFSFYMPMMIPVTLFAVFKNKFYWQSAIASMIGGLLFFFVWERIGGHLLPSALVGTVLGALVYWLTDIWLESKKESNK